jgi:membrane protein YdbS with pleckstrin-like domain
MGTLRFAHPTVATVAKELRTMARDKALIKAILQLIESSSHGIEPKQFTTLQDQGYSTKSLMLHLEMLYDAHFVKGLEITNGADGLPKIQWKGLVRLTWQGYEFLETLKQEATAVSQASTAPSQNLPANSPPSKAEPERVLWEGQPAWAYYTGAFISGAFLLFVFLTGLLVLIWVPFDRNYRKFTITNRRVKSTVGFIRRKSNEVVLQDIRLLNVNQGFFERLFNLASIEIGSAGTGQIEVAFVGIEQAQRVKDLINRYRDSFPQNRGNL